MPPITVVWPSLTSTCVFARWVLIGGMLLTWRLKSGVAFSTEICMITVFADVICGVTFRVSAASLKRHRDGVVGDGLNRNLHALRHFRGDVVLRRDPRRREQAAVAGAFERGQRDVEVEGAVDRAERQADRARGAGTPEG